MPGTASVLGGIGSALAGAVGVTLASTSGAAIAIGGAAAVTTGISAASGIKNLVGSNAAQPQSAPIPTEAKTQEEKAPNSQLVGALNNNRGNKGRKRLTNPTGSRGVSLVGSPNLAPPTSLVAAQENIQ